MADTFILTVKINKKFLAEIRIDFLKDKTSELGSVVCLPLTLFNKVGLTQMTQNKPI